jgi:hypothetical protein
MSLPTSPTPDQMPQGASAETITGVEQVSAVDAAAIGIIASEQVVGSEAGEQQPWKQRAYEAASRAGAKFRRVAGMVIDFAGATAETLNQPEVQRGLQAVGRVAGQAALAHGHTKRIKGQVAGTNGTADRGAFIKAMGSDHELSGLARQASGELPGNIRAARVGAHTALDTFSRSYAQRRQARSSSTVN